MPLRKEDTVDGTEETYTEFSGHGSAYTIIKWRATGAWSCNCPDWVIRRAKLEGHSASAPEKNHCKHVRLGIRGELRPAGATVYLAPLTRAELKGRAVSVADEEV